ncbi:MAG: PSD1 and planctomycete cytochrome C domain-containing protein [Pirellulales bacterium]
MTHRKSIRMVALLGVLVSPMWTSLTSANDFYSSKIKPLLKAHCTACHGGLEQAGGLRLDTGEFIRNGGDSGRAVNTDQPELSFLLERITAADPDQRMPPDGVTPLTTKEIGQLRRWIEQGAQSPLHELAQKTPAEHWAFQPLSKSPEQADVDSFIDAHLSEVGLTRNEAAKRLTLLRRTYLDMHGLLPSQEQIVQFLADDSPNAYARIVDQVLASPRYGERWAQHWLDIIRYADTDGFEVNTPRENAWPYRDYVIQAFNLDKPYDQFITEQLAGDAFDQHEATGFLVAAPALLPGQIGKDAASKRLARQDSLDEIIVGTSATLLGLTVGCARCHDHKFDPISQREYYAMQAFFAGVEYGEQPVEDPLRADKLLQATLLRKSVMDLDKQLASYQPRAFPGRTLSIDDEDSTLATALIKRRGNRTNPSGKKRGYRDDIGDARHMPNFSRGRYSWWSNKPGNNLFTYNPKTAGKFRVWLSWGVHGGDNHTHDARYVLDQDGNLETKADQQEIARIDQYYPANINQGASEEASRWSGLYDAGIHEWNESTRLLLRGGETGTRITADILVLQEVMESGDSLESGSLLPRMRKPVHPKSNIEQFDPIEVKYVRFTTLATIDENRHEPCLDEFQVFTLGPSVQNIALAKHGTKVTSSGNYSETGRHQLAHINDGKFGNEFSWISNQRGRGWIQLELAVPKVIDRIVWGRDRKEKFADRLPIRYRIEVATTLGAWKLVAQSTDRFATDTPGNQIGYYQRWNKSARSSELPALLESRQALAAEIAKLEAPRVIFAGIFREPDNTHVLNRGDPEQPQEQLGPQFLSLLDETPVDWQEIHSQVGHFLDIDGSLNIDGKTIDQQRRLALAAWITRPDHPLTARVMANRIWQYHFGQGIVTTPSDFGLNGAEPTHPQLLDWLASELIDSGWSLKHLHRLILLSDTYQQSHQMDEKAEILDNDCRLLWRYPSRRLEAESIRDSMLQVCNKLNLKMGGPGFNFFKTRGGLSGFPPLEKMGPEEFRRMIYAHKIRMERVPVFGAFDCPDAGLPAPRRNQSTTAIQALNLLNSPFIINQADALADHIHEKSGGPIRQQIERVFQLAYGRNPTETEVSVSQKAATDHGLKTVCRAIFNSNEFLFIP